MKTLALQKIREKAQLTLSRIKHRAILMNKNKEVCTFETFCETRRRLEHEFKGYVRAFWDMELLTDEEYENIMQEFKLAEIKLKAEI